MAGPALSPTPTAPMLPANASCGSKVRGALVKHWTVPPKYRSQEQDEAESWLFTLYLGKNRYWALRSVKFNRWYLFFASFLVQFCIGSLYSWSVLNKPIDTLIYDNPKKGMAVNAFYIAVGVFGTSTAIMGPWIERNGPRQGILLGASAYFIGTVVSCISLHFESIAGLYVGYGLFCGFGSGLCYISPVSALQKWFPDYRGTAAGFAVGGYGAGSVVWSKVYLPVIDAVGLPLMWIVIGSIFTVLLYICAVILRNPHDEFSVAGLNMHGEAVHDVEEALHRGEKVSVMSSHEYESIMTPSNRELQELIDETGPDASAHTHVKNLTLIQAIKSPDFITLYLMFFGCQLYGLIVLSKLSTMCVDIFGKTAAQGANIVSINGVFNCVGRLLFPMISDVLVRVFKIEHAFGRKFMFYISLACQIVIIALLPTLFRHEQYTVFVVLVFLLTTVYGGGFGTIPAFLTDMFGAFNIGAMHGIILTAWSIGGVAGGISFNSVYTNLIESGKSVVEAYISNIHAILVVVCVCAVFIVLVRTNPVDRFEPGYHYSLFGKRVISVKPKAGKVPTKDELLVSERV
jgi:MFS family permease